VYDVTDYVALGIDNRIFIEVLAGYRSLCSPHEIQGLALVQLKLIFHRKTQMPARFPRSDRYQRGITCPRTEV